MTLRSLALAALLACAAHRLHAQELNPEPRSLPGWSLERTMREFSRSDEPRGFFPTRGEWTWVLTRHGPGGQDRIGIFRSRAEETEAAIAPGGPLCRSFNSGVVDPGSIQGSGRENGRWRRVGGTRFVPAGRPASSPVFVEWRREDGRWVVSRFGEEEEYYGPPADVRPRIEGVRNGPRGEPPRLPLADSVRVAAGTDWYENKEPIVVGYRLTMYGLPRQLGESDVVRWGTYDGVPVYVEPSILKSRSPDVIYLPVDRSGSFQPYQNMTENPCAG